MYYGETQNPKTSPTGNSGANSVPNTTGTGFLNITEGIGNLSGAIFGGLSNVADFQNQTAINNQLRPLQVQAQGDAIQRENRTAGITTTIVIIGIVLLLLIVLFFVFRKLF